MSESTLTAAAALDAIDEGVLVQDSETQVVYANRAAGELLGVDREELRGRSELPTPCECLSESARRCPSAGPAPTRCAPAARSAPRHGPAAARRPHALGARLRAAHRPLGADVAARRDRPAQRRGGRRHPGLAAGRRPQGQAAPTATATATATSAGKGVLSPREHQVVELLAGGNTGEEVAERLGISPATVRVHVRNATGKLGASTRTQAVAIAVARGEVAAP